MSKKDVAVDVYLDVACPWSYISHSVADKVYNSPENQARLNLKVTFHPFLLLPNGGPPKTVPREVMLRDVRKVPEAQITGMTTKITAAAKQVGLDYKFLTGKVANTTNALRVIWHAQTSGMEWQKVAKVVEAYYRAWWVEEQDLNDMATLCKIAASTGVGLDEGQVAALLAEPQSADFAAEVQKNMADMSSIPKYLYNGGQSHESALEAAQVQACLDA